MSSRLKGEGKQFKMAPSVKARHHLANETGSAATANSTGNGGKIQRVRFYSTLAIAMMLYKGSEMMYKTTINSYLYHTIYGLKTSGNDTASLNSSKPTQPWDIIKVPGSVEDKSQEEADTYQTFLTALASTLSLMSLVIYGLLSDHFGRKFVLIVVVFGYTLQTLIAFAVVVFHFDITYLTIAYCVDGIGGSAFGFSLGCFICIADMTWDKKERALGIALIESLNGVGRITTEFTTTYFIEAVGHEFPILAATFGCVCALVIVILFIPETFVTNDASTIKQDEAFKCCRRLPSPKTLFKRLFSFYFKDSEFPGQTTLFRLTFLIFLLVESPITFRTELTTLIQIGSPFFWSTPRISLYRALEIGLNYIVGLVLLKPFQDLMSDSAIAMIGIISAIAYNLSTGLAVNSATMYLGAVAGTLMLIPKPVVRGFASKMAGPQRQGAMFAGLVAAELVCEAASDIVYYFCYAHSHSDLQGVVFLIIAGALVLACLLIVILERRSSFSSSDQDLSSHRNFNIQEDS